MTDEAKKIRDAKFLAGYLRSAYAESAPAKMRFLEAADLIESLAAELEKVEAVAAQARGLECERDQLKARLEHVEFERDAAVEELKEYLTCHGCANDGFCKKDYPMCDGCALEECPCHSCTGLSNWQWRGPQEAPHD